MSDTGIHLEPPRSTSSRQPRFSNPAICNGHNFCNRLLPSLHKLMWSLAVFPQFCHLQYPGVYTKTEAAQFSSLHRCFNSATQCQASSTPHHPLNIVSLPTTKPVSQGKCSHCQGPATSLRFGPGPFVPQTLC